MSNRIREHRDRLQWTQEQLATRIGTTAQQISRLENDKRGLDDKWLTLLAGAMGLSKADLLTDGHAVPTKPLAAPAARTRRPPSTPRVDFPPALADDPERALLKFWRTLSPSDQTYVLGGINYLAGIVLEGQSETGFDPGALPSPGEAPKPLPAGITRVERMLLDFWRSLHPIDQRFVIDIVNLWANRILRRRGGK